MKSNGGKTKVTAKAAKTAPASGKKPVSATKSAKPVSKAKLASKSEPRLASKPTSREALKKPATKVAPRNGVTAPKAAPAKKPVKTVAKSGHIARQAPSKNAVKVLAGEKSKVVSATKQKNTNPTGKPVLAPMKAVLSPSNQSGTLPAKSVLAHAAKPPVPIAVASLAVAAKPPATLPPVSVPGVVLQKGGRPSSRLQQITVPSMAQSVASNAAKSSFIQTADALPLIAPPLASSVKKDPKLANNWKTKPAEKLTDAELIAMPDGEYMNDQQMAAFRFKLVHLKRDILNSAGQTTEHLREDTVVVPDPADRATIEEEHALELRTRDRERKLLKKIEQSINRIDAGDYGYCDETGEPIGVGRLLARPTATLSLEAQQRRELKQKMFGD
jgi:DnaK suppressor protein